MSEKRWCAGGGCGDNDRVTVPHDSSLSTPAPNARGTTDSIRESIVFVPLVRVTHLHRVFWMYCAVALVFMVPSLIRGGTVALWFGGNLAIAALILGVLAFMLQRSVTAQPRREYGTLGTPMRENASTAHAAGWAAYNFVRPSWLWNWDFDRGGRWNSIEAALRAADAEVPATAAEESIRAELEPIAIIKDLIEPEFIVSSRPMGRAAMIFLMFAVIIMVFYGLNRRSMPMIAINIVFGASLLLTLPRVRKRLPMLRAEGRAPVAAPGIVRNTKGRRWVRGQALMVVQRTRSAGPIWVTLLGPEGLLRWSFSSAKDEDFINLWQRWNHPHPRPELLTE